VRQRKMAERQRHGAREEGLVVPEPVYGRDRADSRGKKRQRVAPACVRLTGRPSALCPSAGALHGGGGLALPDRPAANHVHVRVHRAREILRAGEESAEHERARSPRRPSSRRGRAASSPHRPREIERDEVYQIPASRMIMNVAVRRPAGVVGRAALAVEFTLGTQR
jgi:hypothetical protein